MSTHRDEETGSRRAISLWIRAFGGQGKTVASAVSLAAGIIALYLTTDQYVILFDRKVYQPRSLVSALLTREEILPERWKSMNLGCIQTQILVFNLDFEEFLRKYARAFLKRIDGKPVKWRETPKPIRI